MMAFTVKGVVHALENFKGKKVAGTSQPNITLENFKDLIESALEYARVQSRDVKLRRTGNPSPVTAHPGYEAIVHKTNPDAPFTVVLDEEPMTVDDVIDILKHRKRVMENCARREKLVKAVVWWRVGKPPRVIREEVWREEVRLVAEAKRLGNKPPRSIFGTDMESEVLRPVENDKRQEMKVTLEEHPAGLTSLNWPEEHETWYNQLLQHELNRFELELSRMEYTVTMGLKVGPDGKIQRRRKNRGCCGAL